MRAIGFCLPQTCRTRCTSPRPSNEDRSRAHRCHAAIGKWHRARHGVAHEAPGYARALHVGISGRCHSIRSTRWRAGWRISREAILGAGARTAHSGDPSCPASAGPAAAIGPSSGARDRSGEPPVYSGQRRCRVPAGNAGKLPAVRRNHHYLESSAVVTHPGQFHIDTASTRARSRLPRLPLRGVRGTHEFLTANGTNPQSPDFDELGVCLEKACQPADK